MSDLVIRLIGTAITTIRPDMGIIRMDIIDLIGTTAIPAALLTTMDTATTATTVIITTIATNLK